MTLTTPFLSHAEKNIIDGNVRAGGDKSGATPFDTRQAWSLIWKICNSFQELSAKQAFFVIGILC